MRNLNQVLFIFFIGLFAFNANAQNFGIKAGMNLSIMQFKKDSKKQKENFEQTAGYNVGVTMNYPLTHMFSIETNLFFDTKGTRYTFVGYESDFFLKIQTYYLDLPVYAKLNKYVGNNVKIYGLIGPYVGIGLSGKIKAKDHGSIDVDWGNEEYDDDFRRFDWGLSMGFGIQVDNIQLGLYYDIGFQNIAPDPSDDRITTEIRNSQVIVIDKPEYDIKNRQLRLSVGYNF
ncbi:MAG: PorT family protein [Bacteroidales bacterium]|nr:PorT family protein [Bacteroidales bacterium]